MKDIHHFELSITTQGPTYPPSEVMDKDGNFIVIGLINGKKEDGTLEQKWGAALVAPTSQVPKFGKNIPYKILREITLENLGEDRNMILHTLPIPLPCNNYPQIFAPEQKPDADKCKRPSFPFHQAPIPDHRPEDGRKLTQPITLGQWIDGKGMLTLEILPKIRSAKFSFSFENLIPDSLYTIMALRENDLNPEKTSRPGPLGVPNVFITDSRGNATYTAVMPNPFEPRPMPTRNRIVNVVVLWMSSQISYGGAIGHHGLGGDIHAQLKLKNSPFFEFET